MSLLIFYPSVLGEHGGDCEHRARWRCADRLRCSVLYTLRTARRIPSVVLLISRNTRVLSAPGKAVEGVVRRTTVALPEAGPTAGNTSGWQPRALDQDGSLGAKFAHSGAWARWIRSRACYARASGVRRADSLFAAHLGPLAQTHGMRCRPRCVVALPWTIPSAIASNRNHACSQDDTEG